MVINNHRIRIRHTAENMCLVDIAKVLVICTTFNAPNFREVCSKNMKRSGFFDYKKFVFPVKQFA